MKLLTRIRNALGKYIFDKKTYKFLLKDWISLRDLDLCAEVIKTMRFTRNLRPYLQDIPRHKRILIIAPHPDDEMIGAGGTIIKSIHYGAEVFCIYLTNGKENDEKELIEQSEKVSIQFGYKIQRLGYHSGNIPLSNTMINSLAREIINFRPGAIFLPILLDDHDDHRRANHILWEAYRREMLIIHDFEIWAFGCYTPNWPNVIVDISKWVKNKAEAIRMFENPMKKFDWAHMTLGLNAFNTRFMKKPTADNYIETFHVLPFLDYMYLCDNYFLHNIQKIYYSEKYLNSYQ